MKRLNLYFTLSSIIVLAVTIERFSFTTKLLLPPNGFLRLHEAIQMLIIIPASILIGFFIVYEISGKLEALKSNWGKVLFLLFAFGTYLNATGNGVHEIGSFIFNSFCPQYTFNSKVCFSAFFNDYYFGNIVYFAGAFLMTISLILLERIKKVNKFERKDYLILGANSIIYSLAIMAYAAFDRVLVGLAYVLITTFVIDLLLLFTNKNDRKLPFMIYSFFTYNIGLFLSLLLRFLR